MNSLWVIKFFCNCICPEELEKKEEEMKGQGEWTADDFLQDNAKQQNKKQKAEKKERIKTEMKAVTRF